MYVAVRKGFTDINYCRLTPADSRLARLRGFAADERFYQHERSIRENLHVAVVVTVRACDFHQSVLFYQRAQAERVLRRL